MIQDVRQRTPGALRNPVLKLAAGAVLAALSLFFAQGSVPHAGATFHLAEISEAMFGYNGDPNIQYVEITMLNSGQNMVAGTRLSVFNSDGSFNSVILQVPSTVPVAAAGGRYIMASTGYQAASGIAPEFTFAPVSLPSTGMLCWGAPGLFAQNPPLWDATSPLNYVDCLPYNGYTNANILDGPASPFGLGDGTSSLTRVSALHNSSVDYVLACPSPQANNGVIAFNHDGTIGLRPLRAFDDTTNINSDAIGDNCGDTDADNDGLLNTDEKALGPTHASHALCPTASVDTDPLKLDSDGDLVTDAAECAMGTDPMNPASKPTLAQCAAHLGVTASTDSDGDGLKDGAEFCYFGSDPHSTNTDGDGCGDAREVTSVNNDATVSSADLGIVASAFGTYASGPPPYPADKVDFDMNKDGSITSSDLGFTASKFGPCP